MAEHVSADQFDEAFKAFQEARTNKNGVRLGKVFDKLFDLVTQAAGSRFATSVSDHRTACVLECFASISRYKGKERPFNFFCTIMLNQLRKRVMRVQREVGLEMKYGKYLMDDLYPQASLPEAMATLDALVAG